MIGRVPVPMAHSPLARRALDGHPTVDLVGSVEESDAAEMPLGREESRDCATARADRLFEDATDVAAAHGRTLRTVVEFGDPARTVVECADEADVDLVVMGSHGRTFVSRVLVGDTAHEVIQRAPVPVTVCGDGAARSVSVKMRRVSPSSTSWAAAYSSPTKPRAVTSNASAAASANSSRDAESGTCGYGVLAPPAMSTIACHGRVRGG
jgi:nucleotide-binding universal stress UspA family protein